MFKNYLSMKMYGVLHKPVDAGSNYMFVISSSCFSWKMTWITISNSQCFQGPPLS